VDADPAVERGRPPRWESGERLHPHRSTGVMAMACLREETNATQETPTVAARDRQPDSREGPGRAVWGDGEARSSDETG
jgi:hypothetical protein